MLNMMNIESVKQPVIDSNSQTWVLAIKLDGKWVNKLFLDIVKAEAFYNNIQNNMAFQLNNGPLR